MTGRLVNSFFLAAFVALAVFAAVFLYRDYQHLDYVESQETLLEKRLAALQEESRKREAQLEMLSGDSEYIESIIRAKMKYAKPEETIFRFER